MRASVKIHEQHKQPPKNIVKKRPILTATSRTYVTSSLVYYTSRFGAAAIEADP